MNNCIFGQSIIKDGGKQNVEELKVIENAEEFKAKDYATALEKMQNALKREKQIQLLKQMNEKNKSNVSEKLSMCASVYLKIFHA